MPTKALKPGTILAQPVFHPRRDELILLEKGVTLTAEFIGRLRELEIRCVWVEFPGLEELDGKISERICAGHMALYQALHDSIVDLKGRVAVEMNLHQYRKMIEQILLDIVDNPDHEVFTQQLATCSRQLAGHLSNCCYLSLLLGAHMSGYLRQQRRALPPHIAEDTHRLGLGALMHDIGKLGMPPEMREVCILDPAALTPEYRAHTVAGYERIYGRLPGAAANIVLHHHQRYDGSGFPDRFDKVTRTFRPPPAGEQIHVFARIVGVVDTFDHLLYRNGKVAPTVVALSRIRSGYRGWFDPVVLDQLIRLVPPFTVGSVVELSDGRSAVVVENHFEAPCRPTVRVLTGSIYRRGTRVTGPPLDLRLYREPHIARVDETDVTPYLFDPIPVLIER